MEAHGLKWNIKGIHVTLVKYLTFQVCDRETELELARSIPQSLLGLVEITLRGKSPSSYTIISLFRSFQCSFSQSKIC